MLWLAAQIEAVSPSTSQPSTQTSTENDNPIVEIDRDEDISDDGRTTEPPQVDVYPDESTASISRRKASSDGVSFAAPAAPALRTPLELARAIRPLMRKVPSRVRTILDEDATVSRIAESDLWFPIQQPAAERWLDLALVVDASKTTFVWERSIAEFQRLVEYQGAFRTATTWQLGADGDGSIQLYPRWNLKLARQRPRSPKELLDPAGRRLILLVSDCTSDLWHGGAIYPVLQAWSEAGPLTLLQLLPERLWTSSALKFGFPVRLSASSPGLPNLLLDVTGLTRRKQRKLANAPTLTVPVVTIDADALQVWSRVVAGSGNARTPGRVFDLSFVGEWAQTLDAQASLSVEEKVARFLATASQTARRLAGLMAAVPVSLPVIDLLRETLLPEARQGHIAEVFASGLLEELETESGALCQYDFFEGARPLLIDTVPMLKTEEVLEIVSQYVAQQLGLSIRSFTALLTLPHRNGSDPTVQRYVLPFARIATEVLYRLGGDYAELARQVERPITSPSGADSSERLQLYSRRFEIATVTVVREFVFETARVAIEMVDTITGLVESRSEVKINRRRQRSWSFSEELGDGVELEMVYVPEGNFTMGAPEDEEESLDSERPQHDVAVPAFFMGKYPVTQAQWKAVAELPRIDRDLEPNPANFKGENRPAEKVSWLDAVEFCQRLSKHTGRDYRLPSEAEWEYACRAGTQTPFHFGETITTDLANYRGTDDKEYNWSGSYGQGPKGIYRTETTEVGSFPGNEFGLFDMHGNVWEWCEDDRHGNYNEAPKDGSAWIENDNRTETEKVLRGGSWYLNPGDCRSAYRGWNDPGFVGINVGFRVACGVARTL